MQEVTVPKHGRFQFDPDVYEQVWDDTRQYSEVVLRDIVSQLGGYDSIRDVEQSLSRFELVAMLAEFHTERDD